MEPFYELCQPNNGGVFSQIEVRNGPPLSYIGGKLNGALASLHASVHNTPETQDHAVTSELLYAFRQTLVAYVALYNQLSLSNDPGFPERLARMPKWELTNWLARVKRNGSVSGESKRVYTAMLPNL